MSIRIRIYFADIQYSFTTNPKWDSETASHWITWSCLWSLTTALFDMAAQHMIDVISVPDEATAYSHRNYLPSR